MHGLTKSNFACDSTVIAYASHALSREEEGVAPRGYNTCALTDEVMEVELDYVSVGCSRTPHSADWASSSSGLLAYAAGKTVALVDGNEVSLSIFLRTKLG